MRRHQGKQMPIIQVWSSATYLFANSSILLSNLLANLNMGLEKSTNLNEEATHVAGLRNPPVFEGSIDSPTR